MKWFFDLKIRVKLLIGFILVAIIAGVVGIIGFFNISLLDQADKTLYKENTLAIAETGEIINDYQQIPQLLRDLILEKSIPRKNQFVVEIQALHQKINELLARIKLFADTGDELRAYDKLAAALHDYQAGEVKVRQAALNNQSEAAVNLLRGETAASDKQVNQAFNNMYALQLSLAKQNSAQNDITARQSITTMIVILIAGILIAIALGVVIARNISEPLQKVVAAARQIATGDVEVRITATSRDETGTLVEAFAQMAENIREQAQIAATISAGNLAVVVKPKSDQDVLAKSMKQVVETLQSLVGEAQILTKAAVEGKLDIRGEEAKFQGGYREIVAGLNNTLDAVIKPVQEASAVLQQVAKGNLRVAMAGEYRGDHAQIKEALNNTIEALNQILGEIRQAADQVSLGAQNVSQSSQTLSQGSTEQASSLEEITSSITEMAAQTKQNAANSNQANNLALLAKESATDGNQQMQAMLRAMTEINDSSANISKIIKVIDEIAFQTNILALNAAVEAARAGQHGKGFAVVAEEVRNLAARSADAAKETTAMIESSIKKVENGTQIATDTAAALTKIVENVGGATNLVAEISIASNQQASAIAQINQGIEQVSQVTQSNTAMAEESASASEELSGQAELLKNMVKKFQLNSGAAGNGGLSQLTPDVLRMLAEMVGKNQVSQPVPQRLSAGFSEAAATGGKTKVQINLEDQNFDKYS